MTILSKELLQSLESSANILLGNLRQCVDLAESSGNTALAAGDKDTAGDNSFLRFALKGFGIIDELEEMLCVIRDVLGNANSVTVGTDLLVSSEKTLSSLVSSRSAVGTMELMAAGAFTKSDACLKLSAVEEGVGAVTNTRRIVIALIIVREGTPLRSSIDNAITEDQTTRAADHVARGKLLDEVGRVLLAVRADHV